MPSPRILYWASAVSNGMRRVMRIKAMINFFIGSLPSVAMYVRRFLDLFSDIPIPGGCNGQGNSSIRKNDESVRGIY
jgi:hypothetical protein